MTRTLKIGAAQLGPIQRADGRVSVVARMVALMREAAGQGCKLVVYPELALTSFFPRWPLEDEAEIDGFYEREMPGAETAALFETARELGVGFCFGYAELDFSTGAKRRFNTAELVGPAGERLGKFRKVHIPGHAEALEGRPGQHLEKRFFEVGDLGFPVYGAFDTVIGMAICNDRRWPETYRVMSLQGAELVLIGYNTPVGLGDGYVLDGLANFHNHLCLQSGAYHNSCWVVGVAKAGREEGYDMIGQSCIVAPSGEIVAQARTLDDELISYDCDLDAGRAYRDDLFDYAAHRRPEHYGLIAAPMATIEKKTPGG